MIDSKPLPTHYNREFSFDSAVLIEELQAAEAKVREQAATIERLDAENERLAMQIVNLELAAADLRHVRHVLNELRRGPA